MKLSYRGATYNCNAFSHAPASLQPLTLIAQAYQLKYRGSTYPVIPAIAAFPFVQPLIHELIYRGSRYKVSNNVNTNIVISDSMTAKTSMSYAVM